MNDNILLTEFECYEEGELDRSEFESVSGEPLRLRELKLIVKDIYTSLFKRETNKDTSEINLLSKIEELTDFVFNYNSILSEGATRFEHIYKDDVLLKFDETQLNQVEELSKKVVNNTTLSDKEIILGQDILYQWTQYLNEIKEMEIRVP